MPDVTAYYNEIEPYAAQWLRNLIKAGHIAPGDVDERSIVDVKPDDLRGYGQCHFFAGIGGWSLALRLANWPDDRQAWTGSCPCQPLSISGLRKGHTDERHLWPAFYRLISKCAPAIVFGEQTAGAMGREWMSAVRHDLEATRYAVGAADLNALGYGSHQFRQRLFFVAHALSDGCEKPWLSEKGKRLVVRHPWPDLRGEDTFLCADGRRRPIERGLLPLAHGHASSMDGVRAYGNAIVPQVAAEFIRATALILD